jgi:hypothetical protein
MVCQSPLRFTCPQLDIASGYLYRRSGTIVRSDDEDGVSCRSSACTVQLVACEISHWKLGDGCRMDPKSFCDGRESKEKYFKWRLPIYPFRFEENITDKCVFEARRNAVGCDQTHCLIVLHVDGREIIDFSQLPEDLRIALNEYLKVLGRS